MNSCLLDRRNKSKLKADLSHLIQSCSNSFRSLLKGIKAHSILSQLRKNNDIIILKPEKGNGVVILNKKDYNKGILDIVDDADKFKVLDNDPTISREGKLQRFVRGLKKKVKIDKTSTVKFIHQVHCEPT